MDCVTLINRGGGTAGDDARDRVEAALAAAGVVARVELVEGGDCAARAAAALKAGARTIVAAGGDGTVSTIAGALAGSGVALGVLPLGTLNHFARDLGIPADLDEAARVVAGGRTSAVDVAEVNGQTFINNAAIGLYPLMVVDRDVQRQRLGRSKRLAMLVAALRTMANFHGQRLTLSANGGEARVDSPLLFVGNNDYRLAVPGAGRRESLSEGQLCVLVMRSKSLPGFLAATARALVGLGAEGDMVRLDGVTELTVASHRSRLTLGIDGETASLASPLTFRIRPRALRVIVPAAG